MIYRNFYAELGKLLYAIAHADGKLDKEEVKTLHKIVQQELLPVEKSKDKFGTESAYYTEFEFEFLEEEIYDPKAAFDSFIDYVEDHHTAFDDRLKNICIKVAERLAESCHGTHKKEKVLIKDLKTRLNRIFSRS